MRMLWTLALAPALVLSASVTGHDTLKPSSGDGQNGENNDLFNLKTAVYKDGDTSYLKLADFISTPRGLDSQSDNAISVIVKNLTEYSHGPKTDEVSSNDLMQINLCEDRLLKTETCFVDEGGAPVVLTETTMRYFDVDHGNPEFQGPEVMQFMCTGGSFTLFGFEEEDTGHDGQFLLHMSLAAKALERDGTNEKSPNGLPMHVYDCPDNEWVTLWSSRKGKQTDNPINSVIGLDAREGTKQPDGTTSTIGREQERSMVEINFVSQDCLQVIFANMPGAYQHAEDNVNSDPVKIKRLEDGLELNAANYPDVGAGNCTADFPGRNWLFGGLKASSPPALLTTAAPTVAPTAAPSAAPSAAPTAASIGAPMAVILTLVAAGDVDDVTLADRAALVATIVALADVPPAAVASRLEAASVRYTFHICVLGTAAAEATRGQLNALLPSASEASAQLGVSAEAVPLISIIDGAPHCSLKADGYHALQLLPPAPIAAPTAELTNSVVVGNDPMMKVHGGNFVKFSLTPGVLSPLLSWTSHEAVPVKLELFGMTFSAGSVDAAPAIGEQRSTRLLKRGPPQEAQCQHGIKRRLDSAEQLAAGGAGSGSLACCPAACGQCGGGGCERKPGGSLQCCVYGLVASNQFCQNETSVACIVSAAASQAATGERHKDSRQRQQEEAEFMSIAKKAEEAQRATQQVPQAEGAERTVNWAQASNLAANEAASTMASALAFLAPGKEQAQWFGQLMLKANGVPLFNVSRGEGGFGEMLVEIDGKTMARGWKASDRSIDQSFNSKLGIRSTLKFGKTHVGSTYGQALVVEAPGFTFSIESRPASKFPEEADQIKYGHLNLKFDEDALPKLSKGFLAQLAGVREMTERRRSSYRVTHALPARPSSTALADFESDALWVRRALEDLF